MVFMIMIITSLIIENGITLTNRAFGIAVIGTHIKVTISSQPPIAAMILHYLADYVVVLVNRNLVSCISTTQLSKTPSHIHKAKSSTVWLFDWPIRWINNLHETIQEAQKMRRWKVKCDPGVCGYWEMVRRSNGWS